VTVFVIRRLRSEPVVPAPFVQSLRSRIVLAHFEPQRGAAACFRSPLGRREQRCAKANSARTGRDRDRIQPSDAMLPAEEQHRRAEHATVVRRDQDVGQRIDKVMSQLARAHPVARKDAVLELDQRSKIVASRAPDANVRRIDGGRTLRHGA